MEKKIPNSEEIKKLLEIQYSILHEYTMLWMLEFKSKTRKSLFDLDSQVTGALYALKFESQTTLLNYYFTQKTLDEDKLKKILKPRKGKKNKWQDPEKKQMEDIQKFMDCTKKLKFLLIPLMQIFQEEHMEETKNEEIII